nr:putative reverse transcriptase domain-containing protein [Tanacetum cinerariifolium]
MFKKYTYIDTQGRLKDFKLLDDANILLRTPRQHNMYAIDLNNIVPHKDLTYLVAKASADECILWHRRLVFECLRASCAKDFLLAIPIDVLGQQISLMEYHTILKYRIMIILFFVDVICPVCRKACLNSFRIFVKKEAPVNFVTNPSEGGSTLTPADVLVIGWAKGKHACVNLSEVSPLVRLSSQGFTVGQAALKSASWKVTKHEKACIKNQHMFIPFVFETFVYLLPDVVELLNIV